MIEKFSTLLPRDGQGKRILKSKLLTALGATGVLSPYQQNPEHILERKILLQNAFNTQPPAPVVPAVTLFTSLAAYWKMDEGQGQSRLDSTANGNTLTESTASNVFAAVGKINNGAVEAQNGWLQGTDVPFRAGAGVSFSWNLWLAVGNGVGVNFRPWLSKWGVGTEYILFLNSPNIVWICQDFTANVQRQTLLVDGTTLVAGVFHMYSFGYDTALQQIWSQFDNGTRQTLGCADVMSGTETLTMGRFNNGGATAGQQGTIDEVGYWRRSLTTAEVTKLYNGGAGLPFGSFS